MTQGAWLIAGFALLACAVALARSRPVQAMSDDPEDTRRLADQEALLRWRRGIEERESLRADYRHEARLERWRRKEAI